MLGYNAKSRSPPRQIDAVENQFHHRLGQVKTNGLQCFPVLIPVSFPPSWIHEQAVNPKHVHLSLGLLERVLGVVVVPNLLAL